MVLLLNKHDVYSRSYLEKDDLGSSIQLIIRYTCTSATVQE